MTHRLAKQVSVFLENKSGRLAEVCRTLGATGINIRALSIADTSDFGILRMILDKPDEGVACLRDAGFSVGETHVLAVQIADVPGGLGAMLTLLEGTGVNVEYIYAFFVRVRGDAVVVLRVGDGQVEAVVQALEANDVPILPPEDVYSL